MSCPVESRMQGYLLLLGLLALTFSPAAMAQQQRPFVEHVDVARVLIDARVFDDRGQPIPDLDASHFAVKIGGRPARVESAEWVGGGAADPALVPEAAAKPPAMSGSHDRTGGRGRLIVFLVQRDLERLRIVGLMRLAQLVDHLLQPLTADDRVAVLSFDSHLRIWSDFTSDFARVRSVLSSEIITRWPGPVTMSPDVSLLSRLPPQGARRIWDIEYALRHVAEAVEPLPGAKSLVLIGHGFGRFDARSGSVLLMDGYAEATAALQRARVTVFTLNVTQAHHNSLQAGLQSVSAETGGMYASTFEFPERALESVSRAFAGYYVLFVEKPDFREGVHRIDIRLQSRRGVVMARSTHVESRERSR